MFNIDLEIQLIAILISASCSLLGTFLVLKSMSMISDAISHTILLGIVLAFFIYHDLNSPFLLIGAGLVGIITVYLIELLHSTRLMKEDSAIGVVFPLLFSIAVILITKYAGNTHLDADAVLLGEISFAPFNRVMILNTSIPKSIITGLCVFGINLFLVVVFFKEIKLSIFDKALAATIGFYPVIIHYGIMMLVSVTAVASFDAVGSILVVALMIGPPVTAFLITKSLTTMLMCSVFVGSLASVIGYQVAKMLDVSVAGMITVVIGIIFMIVFLYKYFEKLLQKVK